MNLWLKIEKGFQINVLIFRDNNKIEKKNSVAQ